MLTKAETSNISYAWHDLRQKFVFAEPITVEQIGKLISHKRCQVLHNSGSSWRTVSLRVHGKHTEYSGLEVKSDQLRLIFRKEKEEKQTYLPCVLLIQDGTSYTS